MSLGNGTVDVNHNPEPRELKRASVKEEMVALTGNLVDAVILNHLIKCQAQSRQIERFIEEERSRLESIGQELTTPPTRGWFYKKSAELSEETMVGLADSNIRARLKKMIDAGWVMERENPYIKWDKTKQYRVDIRKISADLETIGYTLDGWLVSRISETKTRVSKTKTRDSETETRISETETRECGNERAIPSSTTSCSIQGKNNKVQQPVVDSSTSLSSVLDDEQKSTLRSELIQLRVSPDRADYLLEKFSDRVGQAVRWWRANQKYFDSRTSPGGAVAASIESPEKYPQVYEQTEAATEKPTPKRAERPQRELFPAAYDRLWESLSETLRDAVTREGKDRFEYLERHHAYELSTEIISEKRNNKNTL